MKQAEYDAIRKESKARAAETIAANAEAAQAAKQEALATAAVDEGRQEFLARAKRIESLRQSTAEEVEELASQDEFSYDDLTNAELSELLKKRELPHSGNKDELIARLIESDNATPDEG
jgi:vacuolar-type H+-ATPase subunit E/Vma4